MSCRPKGIAYEYFVVNKEREPTGSTQAAIFKYLLKYGPATSREVGDALCNKLRISRDSARSRVADLFRSGFLAAKVRVLQGGTCEWCEKHIAREPYHLITQEKYVKTTHSFCSVECRDHYEQRSVGRDKE